MTLLDPTQQSGLDAAAPLLLARRQVIRSIDARGRSSRPDVDILAVGPAMGEAVIRLCEDAREIRSVRDPRWTAHSVLDSHDRSTAGYRRGIRMQCYFDSSPPDAERVLAALPQIPYRLCRAPVQVKVLDRRLVVLDGPVVDGQPSVMATSDQRVRDAALHYVATVAAGSAPVSDPTPACLTARQRDIVTLMTQELTDAAIASALGVSVRTVRGDIAEVLRSLGVRTRFAAGVRLRTLEDV